MSTLKRLLGSLHTAVFDVSPDKGLAFFVRHPDGVAWSVVDETLTATVNGQSKSYRLNTMTVGQLAGQMVLDGFNVTGLQPEFSGLSASVLLDGAGNTNDTNGDRLYAFRDLLRSLLGGYARELRTAKEQIGEALKQMVITQAEGEWLDLWGALYNTPRKFGQTDAVYAPLIPQEAFRIRVNGYAIEKAILDLTGQRVHIEEPWGNMFRLDESRLSGTHRFYDGSNIGYHLIRPVADKAINWEGILEIIERNKAAGVIVLPPEERNRTYVRDPLNGTIWFQQWGMWGRLVKTNDIPRLSDSLILSTGTVEKNYPVAITSLQMLTSVPDELNGRIMPASPSNILGYTSLNPVDDNIRPYHTGFFIPAFVQAYPDKRKTWRTGGKWGGYQTWAKAYQWQVKSRMTSLRTNMFVDGRINGTIISEAAQGADWTIPGYWNEMTWEGNGLGQPDWLTPTSWNDTRWET